MSADDLEIRLAWERHIGRDEAAREWLAAVLRRHREPQRHYHGLHHVAWMVRHLAAFEEAGLVDDPGVTIAAACFHDVVYDPTATGGANERASAALARTALGDLGWTPDRIDRVAATIAATIDHDVEAATDAETRAVLAADLAVLAADPAGYGDYVRAVRREYDHLDDDTWRAGRSAVLRGVLDRPQLFAPEFDRDRWEARARGNLTAELAELAR